MSKATTVLLDDETADRLEQLAASLDRPEAWLIEQAIVRYLEEEGRQVQAITEALNIYRAGEATLTPHDRVMDRLEAKIRARQ